VDFLREIWRAFKPVNYGDIIASSRATARRRLPAGIYATGKKKQLFCAKTELPVGGLLDGRSSRKEGVFRLKMGVSSPVLPGDPETSIVGLVSELNCNNPR
jgi:hypothetical protein